MEGKTFIFFIGLILNNLRRGFQTVAIIHLLEKSEGEYEMR